MSFSGPRARLVDAVFARLGEDASWAGLAEPVRVRLSAEEDVESYERSERIVSVEFLRVRESEVAVPEIDQVVTMLDAEGAPDGRAFRLVGNPRMLRNRVWLCEVTPEV